MTHFNFISSFNNKNKITRNIKTFYPNYCHFFLQHTNTPDSALHEHSANMGQTGAC